MSYCGNCFRDLAEWLSSMSCPCRKGINAKDALVLDKVITLHRQEPDQDFCGGCYNEWPCETAKVIRTWGGA